MTLRNAWGAGFVGLICLVLALSPVGCGGPFTGSVSGTVTYHGKPLEGGVVAVLHPDGRTAQGVIKENGTYTIKDAPGGDVKVTVITVREIPPLPKGIKLPGGIGGEQSEKVSPAGKYIKIPGKYATDATTPLTTKITKNGETFNIDLTD